MSFTNKMDVFDLIINILREHEKTLDNLVERFEHLCQELHQRQSPHKYVPEIRADFDLEHGLSSMVTSILLVDDDETVVNIYKTVLEEEGYSVETASTGLEALNKVKKNKFKLAILDIMLPDVLGDELARKLRRQDERMGIILITGYPAFKDRISGPEVGINNVLLKPIEDDELLYLTKKALTFVC